jgi:triphosphoribosyl-dephospho-CoA synthase
MTEAAERVAAAFQEACRLEVRALKPGNVHVYAAGHGMSLADFEASAAAAAPAIGRPGLTVGQRILEAVRATRAAVGCNTNLGIVLLAAPLAQAALADDGATLRVRLGRVLRRLDVADARPAYEAIRLAAPAGLGRVDRHDVHEEPTVALLQAMAAAAERDRIAAQYATGYRDVFEIGVPRLARAQARWHGDEWAASAAYLAFLARLPDSHIARKFGDPAAEAVRRRAAPLYRALCRAVDPRRLEAPLLAFDHELKRQGLNPGTSADLTVASLFALRLTVARDGSR